MAFPWVSLRGCVQEAIQEKIDSGVIQLFTKQWGAKKPEDPVGQPGFGLLEVRKAQAKHEFVHFFSDVCKDLDADAYLILFISSYLMLLTNHMYMT